ncbi:MAG: acetyl-CoA hydrolase/transferase C-terminal domain-containing protein [Chloroflexota bacterium]
MPNTQDVSAREAIKAIKPGSTALISEACGEPQTLIEALVEDKERLKGTRLIEARRIVGSKYAWLSDYFRIISIHITPDTRELVRLGKADFLPVKLSEAHTLFQSGLVPIDVALIQVSPPDEKGYSSLGVSVGYSYEAALSARIIIAEVNDRMPRTYGRNQLHINQIHYLVKTSRPLLEYPFPQIGEIEMAVARNVNRLIDDGSTLSFGIGTIPEAVVRALDGKHDLGVHSGMITDAIIEPIEKGIITNERKTLNKGKTVTAGAMGTKKLFEFINENPDIEIHPYSYTHALMTLARLDNFVCINSAVEVDLTGQINAESIGDIQISAIGGQADFARGAALSKGGKAIIALTSTARNGETSRIVRSFKEGTIISTPRFDVYYIVTEYGIVDLRGKTLTQRRDALISTAHPKFRDELRRS